MSLKGDGMSTFIGKSIHFDDQLLHVTLKDGRVISTPIKWYGELQKASLRQVSNYRFICRGTGVEWPDLDYQLSIHAMILGASQKKSA